VESDSAARIRDAIARGQYREAWQLWNAYAARLENQLRAGACGAEGAAPAMAEARDLYEWSRVALLSARAHLRERCHALEVATLYGPRRNHTGAPVILTA